MVSTAEYAHSRMDPYIRQLKLLEPWVQNWTSVNFDLRHTRAILRNEYVHLDVFSWLSQHVGPQQQFIRNSKFAMGKGWAYSVSAVVKTDDIDPVHYQHTFFFENANDAMRFKLTWA